MASFTILIWMSLTEHAYSPPLLSFEGEPKKKSKLQTSNSSLAFRNPQVNVQCSHQAQSITGIWSWNEMFHWWRFWSKSLYLVFGLKPSNHRKIVVPEAPIGRFLLNKLRKSDFLWPVGRKIRQRVFCLSLRNEAFSKGSKPLRVQES